jgi:hypothetical protein
MEISQKVKSGFSLEELSFSKKGKVQCRGRDLIIHIKSGGYRALNRKYFFLNWKLKET